MKFLSILYILLGTAVFAQERVLLLNGFLHVGNGETLPSAAISIKNGKIIDIKNSLAYTYSKSDFDTIIDLRGQHIYPGFVAPNSTLGLTEIDAVRASVDFYEVGELNPHIRSQIAYNVESKVMSTVRSNGVLLCQATPRGGLISGNSAMMKTHGWNWEDATILAEDGIHINWPNSFNYKSKDEFETEKLKIETFFEEAKAYDSKNKFDARYEAMSPVFKGGKRVYFHADDVQQIMEVMNFAKKHEINHPVIVGGYDSHLVARQLKDANIPVMIQRPHSLPRHTSDPIDLPYRLASKLQLAGVKFCIQNEGDMEAMNARNIPFLAGTCTAYGLTEEQAIRAVSLSPCEIMGVSKNYGSIEVGKSATLFVSSGNALDMLTHQVTCILIDGEFVEVSNFQKDLYLKYKSKYAH